MSNNESRPGSQAKRGGQFALFEDDRGSVIDDGFLFDRDLITSKKKRALNSHADKLLNSLADELLNSLADELLLIRPSTLLQTSYYYLFR